MFVYFEMINCCLPIRHRKVHWVPSIRLPAHCIFSRSNIILLLVELHETGLQFYAWYRLFNGNGLPYHLVPFCALRSFIKMFVILKQVTQLDSINLSYAVKTFSRAGDIKITVTLLIFFSKYPLLFFEQTILCKIIVFKQLCQRHVKLCCHCQQRSSFKEHIQLSGR